MAEPVKIKKREAKRIETSPGKTQYARDKDYNRKYKKAKETIKQMKKDGQKITKDDYGFYKTYQGETGGSMKKYGASGYISAAQRKAVHASKAEKKDPMDPRKRKAEKKGASMKKFPEIKEKNEGKFTKWVEKNMGGMDTCKAASKIMRSKTKKYSPAVVKMANYANNFGCKTKKKGASMDHGKKGASFNPKLKKAVADGKIKGKFADAIMKS